MRKAGVVLIVAIMVVALLGAADVRKVDANKDGTSITYHLVHPLHKVDAVSKDIVATAELDQAAKRIMGVTVQVDVTTFDSGNSNRDSHAMEVIDAIEYPEAMFTSTQIEQRGDSLYATGKLNFHGITRDVVIAAKPSWSQDKLIVDGAFSILLSDFKVERPSLLMIPVDNTLRFTLTAVFPL